MDRDGTGFDATGDGTDTVTMDTPTDLPPLDISPPDTACVEPAGPAGPVLHHPAVYGGGSVTVATDGCERVYAAWAYTPATWMAVSYDGGATFDAATIVADGWKPFLFVDDMRSLHIVFIDAEGHIAYRNLSTGDAPVRLSADGNAAIHGMEPVVQRVADTRGGSEVAAVWRTSEPGGVWFSTTASGTWVRTELSDHEFPYVPRMCLAGESRAVVLWKESADDGETRDVLAAVSDSRGESFSVEELGPGMSHGSSSLDLACADDGRVLAAWIHRDLDVQVTSLDASGVWHEGDSIPYPAPFAFYPHVSLSGERALVHWSLDFGASFGLAVFDLSGRLVGGPVMAPDFGGDGQPDRILRSCAFGDAGFGLLAQNRHTEGPAILILLDSEGGWLDTIDLGPWNGSGVDTDLDCDAWGRAVAAWRGMDNMSVAVVPP